MRRSALVLAAGLAVVAAALWIAAGPHAAVVTAALLAGIAGAAVAATRIAAARRRRLGPLRRQFALAVAIMLGQVLLAVTVASALMFVSADDAVLVSLIVLFTGLVAVVAAQQLADGVLRDVELVRDGLAAVGDGRRDVRVVTSGDDELAELAGAANAMIERLDRAEHARRDLVAAVSHDLRTPITSLRLLAEAVGDDVVSEHERTEYLRRMRTHIDALGGLIDDLFELSRIEAGDIEWTMQQVALADLVDETVGAMAVQASAKGVSVVSEVEEPLAAARANPEKLQRVLFNLIQNAIRHTPADGSVTVRARGVAGAVEVEVDDEGEGFLAEDRAHVFDALYRGAGQASRTEDGAGLGLAISRAIVEAHGGRIWLPDRPRGGCVRFSIPAVRPTP